MIKLLLLLISHVLIFHQFGLSKEEAAYTRRYFYVGGRYKDNGKGEYFYTGQMYVEHLVPVGGPTKKHPIVFVHGQAQTGTNWLNKPDGGSGWASYFINHGYECYIVDQTFRGRSAWFPENGTVASINTEVIEKFFTATKEYKLWPHAELHTQWPGSGKMGDPIFDAYYASTVQFLISQVHQETSIQIAGAALLDRIGRPVMLMTHSQAGSQGWLIADARPQFIHTIVALEPGEPFVNTIFRSEYSRRYGLTNIPITYYPPVTDPETDLIKHIIQEPQGNCTIQAESPPNSPRELVRLAEIKVLVVTAEASYHRLTDWCVVRFLKQAGVWAEHLELGEAGVHGNGHMMFLEKNSDEVAEKIKRWIEQNN
ncbi:hypothetical protein FQN57_002608 [Myotisia sp. PD_48]|nr:hypothetical protein FQN57_002608 [Myotisia sp. PD_48]